MGIPGVSPAFRTGSLCDVGIALAVGPAFVCESDTLRAHQIELINTTLVMVRARRVNAHEVSARRLEAFSRFGEADTVS